MKDLKQLLKPLNNALSHTGAAALVLLTLTVLFSVYMAQQASDLPTDQDYINERTEESSFGRFDQDTIEKIQRLQAPNESQATQLPNGRINPFTTQ